MISSEPSHCACLEFQKTVLQAAMSAATQSHARRRQPAIAYYRQTMEMGLQCARQADHISSLERDGVMIGEPMPPTI